MHKRRILIPVLVVSLAVACAFAFAGCSNSNEPKVAATVNGEEIYEDDVTDMIESIRSQAGLDDEDSWGEWLAKYGYTPEKVREEMINSYVEEIIVRQYAGDEGVSVEDSEVDSYVDSMKSRYSSDEAWQSALESAGFTEDEYRNSIKTSLLEQALMEKLTNESPVSDDEVLSSAKMYVSYFNGAKRSSHILFSSDDEATAQQVLDQINSGELDFATAAQQYSTDTSSAANGGDVGWDVLNNFVSEYSTALSGLELNQVSGLVTSSYGIHIIKCTDVYTAPDELTSLDQMPTEFVEAIRSILNNSKGQSLISDWISQKEDEADIVINDMPSDVSYNVDMSKYTSDDSSSSDSSSSDSSSDSSSTDDSSSDSSSTDDSSSDSGSSSDSSSSDSSSDSTSSSE